jgi:hypothetical protein
VRFGDQTDTLVRQHAAGDLHTVIGRPVIDDDNLEIPMRLIQDAVHSLLDEWTTVEERNDH